MKKYKTEMAIFLSAFFVSSLFLILLLAFNSEIITNPRSDHFQTAKNFADYGIFSSLPGNPPLPDAFRTPLYPLFLSFFIKFNIPFFVASILQDILFAISAVMVYSLGKKFFEEKISKIAAFVFALEPYGAFVSNLHQSEAFYLPFIIPSIFLVLIYLKNNDQKYLFFSSVFLGAASLVRPVTFYMFFFLFPLALLLSLRNNKFLKSLKYMTIALFIVILIVFPWFLRNKALFGVWQLSSAGGSTKYDFALMFGHWIDDDLLVENLQNEIVGALKKFPQSSYVINKEVFEKNNQDILKSLQDGGILRFSRGDVASKVGEISQKYIAKHPLKYAELNIINLPRLFYDDSYKDFLQLFVTLGGDRHFRGLFYYIINFQFKEIPQQIKNNFLLISVGIIPKLFFALMTLFAFSNLFLLKNYFKNKNRMFEIIIFLTAMLAFYAVLSSPAGLARYRFPFNSFIFLLALNFLFSIKILFKQREAVF